MPICGRVRHSEYIVFPVKIYVERLDGVKEYLDSRPELIGVGSEPQLVIDGVARSTGIVNE